jgi:trans-aconitate methyltransferase
VTDSQQHPGSTGLVYKNALAYRLAMRLLEGRSAAERRATIAATIPAGSHVVDLCCGPALIAEALSAQGCTYLGLDSNRTFLEDATRRGLEVQYWEAETMPIPQADVVCILSSLYQFIPRHDELFERMLASARVLVVISEPVENWATGGSRLLRLLARRLTRVDGRTFEERHTEESLRKLVEDLPASCIEIAHVGRELLVLVWVDRLPAQVLREPR